MHRPERRKHEVTAIFERLPRDAEGKELTQFLDSQARGLERAAFLELLRDVQTRVRDHLTNGSLLVVAHAVEQLISTEFLQEESAEAKDLVALTTAIFDQVPLIEASLRERVLNSAVRSFGRLVKHGGSAMSAEAISQHIENMLQLLNPTDVVSSTIALQLLTELAQNAPTRFNLSADKFLTAAYPFLFHEASSLRLKALAALKACLGVVAQRTSGKQQGWFQELAQKLKKEVEEGTVPNTVRALVALRRVVQYSAGNLLSFFPALAEMLTLSMSNSEALVLTEVVQLIPVLAQMCPQNFSKSLWTQYMDWFVAHLQKRAHEVEILDSVEKLVELFVAREWVAVTEPLPDVAKAIKEVLSDAKSPQQSRQAAIECVGRLAVVLGDLWHEEAMKLLPSLLSQSVSPALLRAAQQIADAYPGTLPDIERALLNFIDLTGFQPSEDLLLVYQVLRSFKLELAPDLLERFAESLDSVLASTNEVELRSAAAHASVQILVCHAKCFTGDDSSEFLDLVNDRLTVSAVLDVSHRLRSEVFAALNFQQELHPRLAQDAPIRRLSYALYDTDLSIRQSCVQLMGHLQRYNYAAVLPLIRELLLKISEDLRFRGEVAITAQILTSSALLLRCVLVNHPRATESFLPDILEILQQRLESYAAQTATLRAVKDPTTEASCALLLCLMQVLQTMPKAEVTRSISRSISRLGSMLTSVVRDTTDRRKRLIAMQVVQQICELTGEALLQQMKTADLMSCLTDLKTNPQTAAELDSIIESLSQKDPHFLSLISASDVAPEAQEIPAVGEMLSFPTDESVVGDETYYSSAAIHASLAVLEDTRNKDYAHTVQCLTSIFGCLQKSGVFYLQRVIPVLAKIVRDADDKQRLVLFQHLSDLVRIAGSDVGPYCITLKDLCFHFWLGSTEQSAHILNLMAALARSAQASFATSLKELIPRLVVILSDSTQHELVEPALGLLQACDAAVGEFLPVLFPNLIQFLQKVPIYEEPISLNIQRDVLKTLRHILMTVKFREEEKYLLASKLCLTLIELLGQMDSLQQDTKDTLVVALSVLGSKISHIFVHQISKAMGETEEGDLLQTGLARLMDPNYAAPHVYTQDEISSLCPPIGGSIRRTRSHVGSHQLDVVKLVHAWNTADRNTREDWEEWMRNLSVELLQQSSSPALRACHCLAQLNPSVAKWLFRHSLLSVWSGLDTPCRQQLQGALETVLMTPAMPLEVVQPIVSLGEYLNFIEQQEVEVTSDLTALDTLAQKCSSYSTVLHYRMLPL